MTLHQLLDHVRAYVAEQLPGQVPAVVRIDLTNGGHLVHALPLVVPAARPALLLPDAPPGAQDPLPSRRHSVDFRSVVWDGTDYTFSPNQAAVIGQLWQAWEKGVPDLSQACLLEGTDEGNVNAERLRDVFRRSGIQHPAWGALIVRGNGKGIFRLNVEGKLP
jgi:hypothetical protein